MGRSSMPHPRSREEFLDFAKTYVQEACRRQWEEGHPVVIRYLRGPGVPTGSYIRMEDEDGHVFNSQVVGKGHPFGVILAYRGGDGVVRVGWSLRNPETESGLIVYRTGKRAGKMVEFTRQLEPKSFSRTEGLFKSMVRAENTGPRDPIPLSIADRVRGFLADFPAEEARHRGGKGGDAHGVQDVG